MKHALVLCLLVCVLCAPAADAVEPVLVVANEPADRPWWQRAQWRPRATLVQGVPIKRLHPDWCAAEALQRERFDAAVGAAAVDAAIGQRPSSSKAKFDGRGATQIAFVGAYRRCSGEQGLFAAIVEPGRERCACASWWSCPTPAAASRSSSREPDGTLAAWWCADCANGNRIAFNRDKREFYVAGPATRR